MAVSSTRTSVCLAAVAITFILVIIILLLAPEPCRRRDPRPECRVQFLAATRNSFFNGISQDTTTSTTTKTTTSTTTSMSTSWTTTTEATNTQANTTEVFNPVPTDVSNTTTEMVDTTTIMNNIETTTNVTTDEEERTSLGTTGAGTPSTNATSTTSTDLFENTTNTSSDVSESTTLEPAVNETEGTTNSTQTTTQVESETPSTNETSTTSTTNLLENTTTITSDVSESTTWEPAVNETEGTTNTSETTTQEATETPSTNASSTTTMVTETTTQVMVESTTSSTPSKPKREFCDTPICREVARRMLDIMDPSDVEPCEDFYQFACGGILDDQFLKPEDPQLVADNIIKEALVKADRNDHELRELTVVYDSCLNYTKSHDPSKRLLKASDVFGQLGYRFNPRSVNYLRDSFPEYEKTFDLSVALAEMMKRNFAPLFEMMIDVAGDNRTELQFKMILPDFRATNDDSRSNSICFSEYEAKAEEAKRTAQTFDVNRHYDEYVNCQNNGNDLKVRLDKMEQAVRDLDLLESIPRDESKERLLSETSKKLHSMMKEIAKILPSPPELRMKILSKDYETFTVRELDNGTAFGQTPINFKSFFEVLLNKSIDIDTLKVQVYFKDVFDGIFNIAHDYYKEQQLAVQNMLLLLWAERVYDDLVKPLGPPLGSQDYCFHLVTTLMDDYVSYLYLKEIPQWGTTLQTEIQKLVNMNRLEALSQLGQSSSKSKDDFTKKLQMVGEEVPSFNDVKRSILDARKVVMSVTENNFTNNYIALMMNYRQRLYEMISGEANMDNFIWSQLQFIYKADSMTSYGLNKILIPYAALSPPLYYDGVPGYINYAGIGHTIAHELMHGFDSTGMKYNAEDKTSMTNDNALIYQTECLAEQLQQQWTLKSATGFTTLFKLPSKLSQDEMLAESAATKLAWKAYQRGQKKSVIPDRRRSKSMRPRSLVPGSQTDLGLPHLRKFSALQLYFIKRAQNQCSATTGVDIIQIMETEHLPPKLRVNLMLWNEPMFLSAFNCSFTPRFSERQCPYAPMNK